MMNFHRILFFIPKSFINLTFVKMNAQTWIRFSNFVDNHRLIHKYGDLEAARTRIDTLRDKFQIYRMNPSKLTFVGNPQDGGYWIYSQINPNGAVVSCGVGDNISFESQYSHKYPKAKFFLYDHTIEELPIILKNSFFYKQKIQDIANNDRETTLANIFDYVSDEISILKIDIEGDEKKIFRTVEKSLIQNVDQIILEIHGIIEAILNNDLDEIMNLLNEITLNHKIVNINYNNWDSYKVLAGVPIPNTVEISLVNNKFIDLEKNEPESDQNLRILKNDPSKPNYLHSFIP